MKINKIKFGLKIWSGTGRASLGQAKKLINEGIFDYMELLAVPGESTSDFEKAKIPYILHIPHDSFGFNIGEKDSWDLSFKILEENIKLADRISAKYLILHPGFGELKTAKKFLEKVKDPRILIENMPKVGGNNEKMIGYTPEQVKEMMSDKFGFCLDFVHAIKAALSLGADYKTYVKEFLALKPKMFHIYDDTMEPGQDNHLNIGEGEYDMKFLLNCILGSDSKMATLETPRKNLDSLEECLADVKKLKNLL